MVPPKVVCKFTNEELHNKTIEINITDDPRPLAVIWTLESLPHPDGDGRYVAALSGFGDDLPRDKKPNAIGTSWVQFPQRFVDLIERHPDQSVAEFRLVSPPKRPQNPTPTR
jgi:hypothetical protein